MAQAAAESARVQVEVRWSPLFHQPLYGSGCARRIASFETGGLCLLRRLYSSSRHIRILPLPWSLSLLCEYVTGGRGTEEV